MKTDNKFHICPLNVSLAQTSPDYDDGYIEIKVTLEMVNPQDNWGWDEIAEHIDNRHNMLRNMPWIKTDWCMGDTDESIEFNVSTKCYVESSDGLNRAMSSTLEVLNNFIHTINVSLPSECGFLYTINDINITPATSIPTYNH